MNYDVVLVDIIGEVVSAMQVPDLTVHYEAGTSFQIIKSLSDFDNSVTQKDDKYPLVALILPVREKRGLDFYATVTIPRIVIATLTRYTDDVKKKYQTGGTFKSILYPCYNEFLRCLAKHKNVLGQDTNSFRHDKLDNPSEQVAAKGSQDFIDTLELLNLEITLIQSKTC